MDHTRDEIYLAALLHDIGKFYQRADERLMRQIVENDTHLTKIAELICPFNEEAQNWGYQHALWAYLFFLEAKNIEGKSLFSSIKENGKEVFRVNPFDNEGMDNLINFAIFHHKPQTKLQALVQLADWISSGMERNQKNAETSENETVPEKIMYGKFRYKKVPLFSIMNILETGRKNKHKLKAFNRTALSCSEDSTMPKDFSPNEVESLKNHSISESYNSLWKGFMREMSDLPLDSVDGFTESMLFLLKRYTWCIPASTNDLSDISLFEHLKTTAAFAQCLFDYQEKYGFDQIVQWKQTGDKPAISKGVFPFLMVCWDLSGIQKFIYDISGRKAAVSLKGRSFYLQLLVESIIQKTILKCKAKWGNVIYNSGGKFFMLLPNLPENHDFLMEIKQEFEVFLWEEHHGKLSLCMGKTEFSYRTEFSYDDNNRVLFSDNSTGTVGDLWRKVLESASESKFRKFETLIQSGKGNSVFQFKGKWGKGYDICAVTGVSGRIGKDLVEIDDHDFSEKIYVTRQVKNQITLGQSLKDADYILTYLKEDEQGSRFLTNRSTQIQFPGTGINHYIFNKKQLTLNDADFRTISSADVARVRRINETDFSLIAGLKGHRYTYGFLFYGGNQQAVNSKTGKLKTFEELCWIDQKQADMKEDQQKRSYLGVLRMDVDNLGKLFMSGIPEKHRSFAAYATLSFMLEHFFSGHLNRIRQEFADYVNIVYSGGDDVFAVGRWDKLILFAEKVKSEFERYTGRDDITVSAGIAIVGEKYPIRLAADEAGLAEEKSKDYTLPESQKPDKNAVTFFGQTISWEHEWDEVKALKETLFNLVKPEIGISKALLHQLMRWKLTLDENRNGKHNLSYKWNTAYYLKRYRSRLKPEQREAENTLKKLEEALFTGQGMFATSPVKHGSDRYYELAALAARWAEMELKEFN
jgi:CRISPR-associated protein Csm1